MAVRFRLKKGEDLEVLRTYSNGRWRRRVEGRIGPYVATAEIASRSFVYCDDPPLEQRLFMEGHIEDIGRILDDTYRTIAREQRRLSEDYRLRSLLDAEARSFQRLKKAGCWYSKMYPTKNRDGHCVLQFICPVTGQQSSIGPFNVDWSEVEELVQKYEADINKTNWADQVEEILDDDKVRETPAYVYLMRHANGLTKIGMSVRPRIRERTLQAEDPRLEMIFKAKVSEPKAVERRLHEEYRSRRKRGEWFDLEPRHVDRIIAALSEMKVE